MHRFAAQRGVKLFVLFLGERRCHAVGGVEARERGGAIHTGIFSIYETFPADLFEIGELEIRPGFNVFGDPFSVFVGGILADAFAVGVNYAHFAVIEIHFVLFIYRSDVVSVMGVDVADDQVNVGFVAQHNFVEEINAELRELNPPASHLFDLFALFFGDAFGESARNRSAGMHFAPADHLDDGVTILAGLNHFAADL